MIRSLYRLARRKLHVHLVRVYRRRHRAFLQMPVAPPSRWPTVNDSHSVDSFRRTNR